jgi:hypothetical protein
MGRFYLLILGRQYFMQANHISEMSSKTHIYNLCVLASESLPFHCSIPLLGSCNQNKSIVMTYQPQDTAKME